MAYKFQSIELLKKAGFRFRNRKRNSKDPKELECKRKIKNNSFGQKQL